MKKRSRLAVVIAIIMATTSLLYGCNGNEYYTKTQTVFSSSIVASVKILSPDAKQIANEMISAVECVGEQINANSASSQLYSFNQSTSTEWLEIGEHFYNLCLSSKQIYDKTNGAFNPAVSPASKLWCVDAEGINRYGYGQGQPDALPSQNEIDELKASVNLNALETKTEQGKYYIRKTVPTLRLDFGGVAKGYCADLCAEIAQASGVKSALIDISGNLVLVGKYYDDGNEKDWGVGVINPRREENSSRYVCGFTTSGDISVVTAGDYERYYEYQLSGEKMRVSHIINGNTLIPTSLKIDGNEYIEDTIAVCSATVMGSSSMLCDAYATAVVVMGAENGKQFLQSEGLCGLIFTADKKMAVVGEFDFVSSQTLYQTEYECI